MISFCWGPAGFPIDWISDIYDGIEQRNRIHLTKMLLWHELYGNLPLNKGGPFWHGLDSTSKQKWKGQEHNSRVSAIAESLYKWIHTIFIFIFLQRRHSHKMKAKLKHFTFYSLVKFSLYLWSKNSLILCQTYKPFSRILIKCSQSLPAFWKSLELCYCFQVANVLLFYNTLPELLSLKQESY